MRKWVAFGVVALAVLGCVPSRKAVAVPVVRPDDVASWAGVPIIELETHAVFSILPKELRTISDGTEMWIFTSCASTTTDRDCKAVGSSWGRSAAAESKCRGGEKLENCCHNQFIVKDGTVASYRPTGSCWTDCRARPQSRPCP